MNWKKVLSLMLLSLILLTCTACGGGKQPAGSESEKDGDKGFFEGIFEGIFGDETDDTSPLSKKSDEELIAQFLAEYEKALNAPAYFKEYNFSISFDSNTLVNSLGYFMVNGKDFSVDWVDYVKDENSATFIYKDGILYAIKDGEESQKTVGTEAVRRELEALGTVYREVLPSEFAAQTLTRNEDGSFLLNVTLTGDSLQRISAEVLNASAEISGTRTFRGVTVTIAFNKDGTIVRSRLLANLDVTAEDGTVRGYVMEEYLKYTSFDASKIVISAPEQTPDWEDSGATSDGFLTTDSAGSDSSDQTADTKDEN